MGNVITAVCVVSAMSGQMTQYDGNSIGNFTYTYIVNGANCAWQVNFNDPNGQLEIFNTTNNQHALETFLNCTLTATGCTTQFQNISGVPYTFYSQDFEELNVTNGVVTDVQNFTYVLMPPVPVQPSPIYLVNNSASVFVTTSAFSQEFGSALTGCVVSAGAPGYTASDLPASLSSNAGSNSLPFTSFAMYSPPQNTSYTIYLNQLNLNPNTAVDIYFVCYNGNGQSWPAVRYQQTTAATLPPVVTPNAASPMAGTAWSMAAVALTALTAMVALMV